MEFEKNLNNHGKIMEFCENLMKPQVARKLAVGHMCPTASFLATGCFKFLHGLSTSNLLLLLHSAFML